MIIGPVIGESTAAWPSDPSIRPEPTGVTEFSAPLYGTSPRVTSPEDTEDEMDDEMPTDAFGPFGPDDL